MSAQDMAKMSSQAATGSDTADQVCARFPAGSAITAPPELESQNGVLEVTFKFLTVTDSQGLVRYCYVTDTGLEAPTLRVNPGDKLIIHFQNDLPAATAASSSGNMAGMKMTLSPPMTRPPAPALPATETMRPNATNIHFHGTNVAPVCGQDEVVHTLIQPGQSFDYNVQIPHNEPPGLYWYHPHPHGFSEGQVQGGATGALIVEGMQNVDPALAGLPERTLSSVTSCCPRPKRMTPTFLRGTSRSTMFRSRIRTTRRLSSRRIPGQQELWRVANTAADTILDLQYVVNGTPQAMQVSRSMDIPSLRAAADSPQRARRAFCCPPARARNSW